jgi:beta-glucanase (GH16 family)
MKLIKHFDFTSMTHLDPKDWNIEVGEKWANNEAQQYTDDPKNIFFDDGLHIKATLNDGIIESGRINTKNKFYFKYGKIDIVAKVPKGKGTWPALWMMPQNNTFGHWPKSGEIDIMEHCGKNLDELFLCIHTEKYNHRRQEQYYRSVKIPNLSDDFHTFSLLWNKDSITYYLDEKELAHYQKGEQGKDDSHHGWPFDEDFYFIINLAMGGTFGGEIDMDCFPQEFIVKDVKIYQ